MLPVEAQSERHEHHDRGDAGQGVESGGAGFALSFARSALHVFATQDYRSRIRGGHNFYQIRLSERPCYSHSNPVHLLLALTPESVWLHLDNMAEGGAVIFPERFVYTDGFDEPGKPRREALVTLTFEEHDGKTKMTSKSLYQTAADRDAHLKMGMEAGAAETLDRLAEHLGSMV